MLTHDRLLEIMDYDPASGFLTWKLGVGNRGFGGRRAGTMNRYGYRVVIYDGSIYSCHRLSWFFVHGVWPIKHIDHINGDKADNRLANLREASHFQNLWNRGMQKNNSTGFKGVSFVRRSGKFQANIKVHRKQIHLGLFETAEEASAVYEEAAEKHFGDFNYAKSKQFYTVGDEAGRDD